MVSRLLLTACVLLVSASDVSTAEPGDRQDPPPTAQSTRQGTWAASSGAGPTLNGTWTAAADPATGNVTGTWTLIDPKGRVVARGVWSAAKSARGWRGAWRAAAEGRKTEYSGTWSADIALKPNAPFASLFESAVKGAVGGSWRAGRRSGTWSIRAAE